MTCGVCSKTRKVLVQSIKQGNIKKAVKTAAYGIKRIIKKGVK